MPSRSPKKVRAYFPNPDEPYPVFGVNAHGPDSPCPHRGPFPEWSNGICMKCHATGARLQAKLTADRLRDKAKMAEADNAERKRFMAELKARRFRKPGKKSRQTAA